MSPKSRDLEIEDFHRVPRCEYINVPEDSPYELIEVPKDGYCLLWSFYVLLRIQLNWDIQIFTGRPLDNLIYWFCEKFNEKAQDIILKHLGKGVLPEDLTLSFKDCFLKENQYIICHEVIPTIVDDNKLSIFYSQGHFSPLIPKKIIGELKPKSKPFQCLVNLSKYVEELKSIGRKSFERDLKIAKRLAKEKKNQKKSKKIGCFGF